MKEKMITNKKRVANTLNIISYLLDYNNIMLRDDSVFDIHVTNNVGDSDMMDLFGNQTIRINAVLHLESKGDD